MRNIEEIFEVKDHKGRWNTMSQKVYYEEGSTHFGLERGYYAKASLLNRELRDGGRYYMVTVKQGDPAYRMLIEPAKRFSRKKLEKLYEESNVVKQFMEQTKKELEKELY